MPKDRFSLDRYWLDREPKSPNWLRCWYDAGARRVRRRSLGTDDFEEAKLRLAEFVLTDPAQGPQDDPLLIVVLKHYWETWSDQRRDPGNARRAGALQGHDHHFPSARLPDSVTPARSSRAGKQL